MTKTELLEKELRHQDNISIRRKIEDTKRYLGIAKTDHDYETVEFCQLKIAQLQSRLRTEK